MLDGRCDLCCREDASLLDDDVSSRCAVLYGEEQSCSKHADAKQASNERRGSGRNGCRTSLGGRIPVGGRVDARHGVEFSGLVVGVLVD